MNDHDRAIKETLQIRNARADATSLVSVLKLGGLDMERLCISSHTQVDSDITESPPFLTSIALRRDNMGLLDYVQQSAIQQKFKVIIDISDMRKESMDTPRSDQIRWLNIRGEKVDCERASVSRTN